MKEKAVTDLKLVQASNYHELKLIAKWLEFDDLGKKEMSEYLKTDQWFSLINNRNRLAFFITKNSENIGFTDLEILDDRQAYFSFYIKSDSRGHGYGAHSVKLLLDKCYSLRIQKLIGGVNVDNLASQKSLQKLNFKLKQNDNHDEEYQYFEFEIL